MPVWSDSLPKGRVKREMSLRGLKPSQVIEEAGISESTLYRAMAGKPIKLDSLLALSTVFTRHVVKPGMADLMDEGA